MNNEPVLSAAGITATATAILNMLVVLDVLVLDPEQVAAVNIAIGSVISLLLAFWARNRVTTTAAPVIGAGTTVTVDQGDGTVTTTQV